jgi:hypothetical protein
MTLNDKNTETAKPTAFRDRVNDYESELFSIN